MIFYRVYKYNLITFIGVYNIYTEAIQGFKIRNPYQQNFSFFLTLYALSMHRCTLTSKSHNSKMISPKCLKFFLVINKNIFKLLIIFQTDQCFQSILIDYQSFNFSEKLI